MTSKILLINPPQLTRYPQPPLGLAFLAAALERHDYEVRLFDMPALGLSEKTIPKVINRERPDFVGITAMTPSMGSALNVAKKVKASDESIIVGLGGPHATVLPEKTLEAAQDLDIIIRGEGEQTIVELMKALQEGTDLMDQVLGITYRKGNCIKSNPIRPPILDMDSLPFPAFNLLPMEKYRLHPPFGRRTPAMPIITSRGCPYRCIFCSKSVFGKKYRANSPSYVVDEILFLKQKFGIEEIKFYDDSFTLDRKRIFEICRLLKKEKIDIKWTCETRVNLVNSDLLRVMKDAGCYMIEYGVESGVQEILCNLKKDITLKETVEAFDSTHKLGIETVAYFMIGAPEETVETISKTIEFAKKLDPDFAQFSILTPLPGTELFDLAFGDGMTIDDWGEYVYSDLNSLCYAGFGSKFMDRVELGAWNKRAYLDFYLRWSYFVKRLRKTRSLGELKTNISGLNMLLRSVK
jgi:anaerobic magnesium-protoporphyrin IX monomethyl ester cyclase